MPERERDHARSAAVNGILLVLSTLIVAACGAVPAPASAAPLAVAPAAPTAAVVAAAEGELTLDVAELI